ncbi:hypothetical protein OG444_36080 [Streptomyces sp. NBC_01232]|uniref:hypothetical protein n=1 Tax=Streptomyces sp. NBC_01232 TaxID=2903786 RepID=UPI002E103A51|nr:hypothetical protein OG444_36080 [Streptomyces sp. NBC_01232]
MPALRAQVGARGHVLGVDVTPAMPAAAARHGRTRHGHLVAADCTRLPARRVRSGDLLGGTARPSPGPVRRPARMGLCHRGRRRPAALPSFGPRGARRPARPLPRPRRPAHGGEPAPRAGDDGLGPGGVRGRRRSLPGPCGAARLTLRGGVSGRCRTSSRCRRRPSPARSPM